MKQPLVSVIIPTYNEERDIAACLRSLEQQNYPKKEVIVVDDGSTDRTTKIVSQFKNVKSIKGKHKGPGFSRNLGARKAKGEILIFIDADMTFDKAYITNLVQPIITDKEVIGTTHDYETAVNTTNVWSLCWGTIRVSKETAGQVTIFRAIRRESFLERGGFDPKYGYADDQTFWYKYKLKPRVAPRTICYHKNAETLREVYKQSRWIGASIDSFFLKTAMLMHITPLLLAIVSPVAIPLLSIKKAHKNKVFKLLIPWMIIFMTARYFGTVTGIIRRVYLHTNVR